MIYFNVPPPIDYCVYEAFFCLVGMLLIRPLRLGGLLLGLSNYLFSMSVGVLFDFGWRA